MLKQRLRKYFNSVVNKSLLANMSTVQLAAPFLVGSGITQRERDALFALGLQPPRGDFFERIIHAIYAELLRPGDFTVDCGANWATHTVPMSEAVGPSGRVIAIEAIPELASHLKNQAIGNVEVIDKAIAAKSGSATFHVVADNCSYSSLRERDDLPPEFTKGVTAIDVAVTTLDDILCDRRKPIRLIKMDLEGGEYNAIAGGRSVIGKDLPFVVFESSRDHDARLYGYSRDDFFDLFDSLSLHLFDLFGRPFGRDQWEVDRIPWNFIAVSPRDEPFVTRQLPRLIRELATNPTSPT